MKFVTAILFCICIMPALALAQEPFKTAPQILEPDKFDEWGDLRLNDENVHLDKIANQAKEWPLSIIHIVVHAGQTACVGEAKARGIRAKNYLVEQGIEAERINLVDAGWRKEVSVQVWIWPALLGTPKVSSDLNLKPRSARLERNCKMKYRGRLHR